MAILKSIVKNQFSIIPNEVIRDKTLSHSEYRLLIYLYSLPDNWKINQSYLASELETTRNKINQRLASIKKQGYLDIEKNSKSNKEEVDYLYILKVPDTPKLDTPKLDTPKLDTPKTGTYINNTNNINNELNNSIITPKSLKSKNIKEEKKKYGKYQRIILTDKEYLKLLEEHGKETLDNQIRLLDEYLEINNNKNKYTNFNLVLQKSFREKWFKTKEEKPKEEKVYFN